MQWNKDMAREIRGKTLYASDSEKIGEIEDIFLDDQTGEPEWVQVGIGLMGRNHVLVPLETATVESDGVRSSYPKDKITDAPRIHGNYIAPEDESTLYQYYGLAAQSPSEMNEARVTPHDTLQEKGPVLGQVGEGPGGVRQSALDIPEEQTLTTRGTDDPGKYRLRKWVD